MARSVVLLKLNVANILLFNFCEQKFVQHDPIMIATDCNGLSLLIFEEKWSNYTSGAKFTPNSDSFCIWTKIRTKQWLFLGASAFQCMRTGFLCSKRNNFACLHTRQDQNELHLKKWFFFFAKIGIFCKSIAGPPSEAYTQPYSFGGRIKPIICQIRHELSVTIHDLKENR